MKKLFFIPLFLLLCSSPALAGEQEDVENRLKEKISGIISLLRAEDIDKKERNDKIIDLLTPIFDFPKMAKLSLGKKYWPGLSKEKRAEFSDLFIKRLQESYLDKFDLYSDEEVTYEKGVIKKNKLHIESKFISPDNKIEMLYKFYKSKKGWKIYDVKIQGVSIIQTYRSQFDGVLRKGTIDDLIARLDKKGEFNIPSAGK